VSGAKQRGPSKLGGRKSSAGGTAAKKLLRETTGERMEKVLNIMIKRFGDKELHLGGKQKMLRGRVCTDGRGT